MPCPGKLKGEIADSPPPKSPIIPLMNKPVHVVGAGLAGSECAYQLARRGIPVVLYEMRPVKSTPAHSSAKFAELVCSNSLRSDDPFHAAGLLKREMEAFGSLIIGAARRAAVPAGSALAVDRELFADEITETLRRHPDIEIRQEEVTEIPQGETVLATGPLTSEALSQQLLELLGSDHLYFFDAIAPIVEAESLDLTRIFAGSRYGKGEGDDYLNIPLDRDQYLAFHEALVNAEVVQPKEFEDVKFFEGCLPVEEIARRGVDTLRFGPMKPVGLTPPDGSRPYAVAQLRQEDLARSHYNFVGFQSRLKWGEQKRIFGALPGLENARFVRLGQIHRNTFINAPIHLDAFYRVKEKPSLRLAGQITGVEGYLESAATGLAIALYATLERGGRPPAAMPATTAFGAMTRHLVESNPKRFQPANINYGLFEPLGRRIKKRERRAAYVERAHEALCLWAADQGLKTEKPLKTPTETAAAAQP